MLGMAACSVPVLSTKDCPFLPSAWFCYNLLKAAKVMADQNLCIVSAAVRTERNVDCALTMGDFTSYRKLIFPGLCGLA